MENAKNGFSIFPINAPYEDQNEIMKDMEAVLGGRYINCEDGDLDSLQLCDVGLAERIVAKRYTAIFTGKSDEDSKGRVKDRISDLNKMYKTESSDFIKRNLRRRIAQLESGFGIIKVGATSEVERSYKLDKAEDAVNAVRVALQEGTVKGAGLAFKEIGETLDDTDILKRPLLSIYEQIMSKAPEGFVVADNVRDPVKVLRVALSNACSVAGTFATAEIAIASERPKPKYMQEVNQEENEN
jgi:chaperonin GroEL